MLIIPGHPISQLDMAERHPLSPSLLLCMNPPGKGLVYCLALTQASSPGLAGRSPPSHAVKQPMRVHLLFDSYVLFTQEQ